MRHQRILVPVDFTERSRAALNYAIDLVKPLHAGIVALHVLWDPPNYLNLDTVLLQMPEDGDGRAALRRHMLARAQAEMQVFLSVFDVRWQYGIDKRFLFGDPATEVLAFARAEKMDLIVAATRGGSGRLGSICMKMVQAAPCPVLAIPAAVLD